MEALIITGGDLEDIFAASYIKEHHFDITIAVDAGMGFFLPEGYDAALYCGRF